MRIKRSMWTTVTGGLTSTAPVLLSCCKGGACVGVCASPVASLFGVSSASISGSPWIAALEPLLIAISAVSFTISYYTLYVLPKKDCSGENSCDCGPTAKEKRKNKINKFIFWFGLTLSIGFFSYFEYIKFQNASTPIATECSYGGVSSGSCDKPSESCCPGDSTQCETKENL